MRVDADDAAAFPLPGGQLSHPPYAAYCLSFAAFGLAGNSFGPMLPSLAAACGVDTAAMSPVIAAGGVGGLLGAILSPTLPLSALLPAGLVSLGLAYAAVPLSTSVGALTVVLGTAATCAQAVAIGGHAEIARAGGQYVTARLNGINACFGLGSLLAPWFHDQLRHVFAGTSSYWPVTALVVATSGPFVMSRVGEASRSPASGMHAASPSSHTTPPPTPSPLPVSVQLGGPAGMALTATILALVCFSVGAEVSYASWLYTHAVQGLSLSGAAASAVVSTFWACMTLGRLCAASVASRGVGPGTILRVTLPLAVMGPGLALMWPSSGEALTAAVALSGLGLSTGFANSVAFLAQHVPPSGTTQALVQQAACGGALVFAPLAGMLASSGVGTSACLWVAGACAAMDVGCFLLAEMLAARVARTKRL